MMQRTTQYNLVSNFILYAMLGVLSLFSCEDSLLMKIRWAFASNLTRFGNKSWPWPPAEKSRMFALSMGGVRGAKSFNVIRKEVSS